MKIDSLANGREFFSSNLFEGRKLENSSNILRNPPIITVEFTHAHEKNRVIWTQTMKTLQSQHKSENRINFLFCCVKIMKLMLKWKTIQYWSEFDGNFVINFPFAGCKKPQSSIKSSFPECPRIFSFNTKKNWKQTKIFLITKNWK